MRQEERTGNMGKMEHVYEGPYVFNKTRFSKLPKLGTRLQFLKERWSVKNSAKLLTNIYSPEESKFFKGFISLIGPS